MRLLSTRIRGLGTFRDEVSLDLEGLDARIVAVRGENGAGKSTLLELAIPGALYRSTPTRGALKDLALARDALLESVVESSEGQRYTIRHLVDANSGKGESVVLDADGAALIESAKVSAYDDWAERHLLSPDVLYASLFGAQQAGGFLAAKPAERKSLLLQILGIQRYEELARGASERARAAASRIEVLRGRLAETRSAKDRATAEAELAIAEQAVSDAATQLALAQESLRLDEEARASEERAVAAQAEIAARRAELEQRLTQVRGELDALGTRRTNNLGLMDREAEIRGAAALIDRQREFLAKAQSEVMRLDGARATHLAEVERAKREARAAGERIERLGAQQAQLERLVATGDEVDAAIAELPAARSRLDTCEYGLTGASEHLRRVQGQQLAGAVERVGNLRSSLDQIRRDAPYATPLELGDIAASALDVDLEHLTAAKQHPQRLREAQLAHDLANAARSRANSELRELELAAARAGEVAAAREQLTTVWQEAEAEIAAQQAAIELSVQSGENARACGEELTQARSLVDALGEELAQIEPIAKRLPDLEQARARVEELDAQIEALSITATALAAQLAGLVVHDAPEPRDLGLARAHVEVAQLAASDAGTSLALARRALADALGAEQRQAELRSDLAGAETELSDWARLADDLGKKGLQAAVIDAALPELVTITNDLLHAAFGPRFTIDVRTQAVNSTGKRLVETLDVVVIDTEAGREAPAETYSGGERVILSEALALALTTLACREHGIRSPTLVRDESGAALSATRAPQWIAMLRRAADLIGAGHVLFVSHDQAAWELADASIVVGDGRVEVH